MLEKLLKDTHLSSFIAFDFETTGLDAKLDSVIEFSGIRFENGKPEKTLSFLCNPGIEIPKEIEEITGITNVMIEGAEPFENRLEEVLIFISDLPLVAHNIGFDLSFLKQYIKHSQKYKMHRIRNRLYDTVLLSQAFFFYLNNFKLGTVAEYFGFTKEGSHRAEIDALNAGRIFIKLVERAALYDFETLQVINIILKDTRDPNKWLYRNLAERLMLSKSLGSSKSPKIDWDVKSNVKGNSKGKLVSDRPEQYFEKGGLLFSELENYEERPQQKEMAEHVYACMEGKRAALIEAGTGVGKSLAYLIPSVIWLKQSENIGSRLVIASNTKILQEQIFYKEIPFLSKKLNMPFKAVLLKGRSNYICLTRWYKFLSDLPNRTHIAVRSSIIPVVIWLKHTKTGDISECNGFRISRNYSIWNEICSEPGYCTTSICQKYGGCFLGKIREQASNANVLVVNHSLLLADAAMQNQVIPEYHVLVVDEGHNFEKNAYEYFAGRVNLYVLHYMLNKIYTDTKPERGLIIDILNFSKQLKKQKNIERYISDIQDHISELRLTSSAFFRRVALEKLVKKGSGTKLYRIKKRFKLFNKEFENFADNAESFITDIEAVYNGLKSLVSKVEDLVVDYPKLFDDLRMDILNMIERLKEYHTTLTRVIESDDDEMIFWYEIDSKARDTSVEFAYTPLDISSQIYEKVFKRLDSVVLTSATLKVENSFDYIKKRTGMDIFKEEEVDSVSVGSPFKYNDQMLFSTYHADIRRSNNPEDLASIILRIAREVQRGIMVLFKSYSSLVEVYRLIQQDLNRLGITLLAQGHGGSRLNLLQSFKSERKSVLLGTDSFWEGVDIIGTSLEVLIIHKVPFAVPSEPIIEANMERINKESNNAFNEYYVPDTILKFRQGIGRLIRSSTDMGVVINLDDRIDKRRYGQMFKDSLPVDALTIIGADKLLDTLNSFFK